MKHQNGLGKVAQITMAFLADQISAASPASRDCSEAPASFSCRIATLSIAELP
jgi:hypothetical protein